MVEVCQYLHLTAKFFSRFTVDPIETLMHLHAAFAYFWTFLPLNNTYGPDINYFHDLNI